MARAWQATSPILPTRAAAPQPRACGGGALTRLPCLRRETSAGDSTAVGGTGTFCLAQHAKTATTQRRHDTTHPQHIMARRSGRHLPRAFLTAPRNTYRNAYARYYRTYYTRANASRDAALPFGGSHFLQLAAAFGFLRMPLLFRVAC